MTWIKYQNGRVRFPRWPRLDTWLERPENERAVIIALLVVCAGVWIFGAML